MQRLDILCKECDRVTIVYANPETSIDPYCVNCGFCDSDDTSTVAFYKSEEEILINITNQLEEMNQRMDALFEQSEIEPNPNPPKAFMH